MLSDFCFNSRKKPRQKKIPKIHQSSTKETRKSSARKSIGCHFHDNVNNNENALINIDDIISPEQSTRAKVLVLWPSGKSDVRVPDIDQKENITLLKNIALINWTAVANAVLTHSELRQDILRALWRTLNSELKNYCSSDSVLKHRTPKELIQKSRKILAGFTDGIITVCHCCLCLKNHARERI